MRKLSFGMNMSLDGYIAAPGDDLGWSVPSDELNRLGFSAVFIRAAPPAGAQ